MKNRFIVGKMNLSLVAILLLGMVYLGLMLFTGTSNPLLLVRGSSMEPTFHAGDLLLSRSVSPGAIQVGDIVAFNVPLEERQRLGLPDNVVHRVIGIQGENGQLVFVTKGDNSDIDPFKVPSSAVRSAVVKNLGPVGRPFLFLTNKTVLLFLGLPVLTFILIMLVTLSLTSKESRETRTPATLVADDGRPVEIGKSLATLSEAIAEYGVHLKSHTAVVMNLGGTSQDLQRAVQQQNEVLADLAVVVREMKHYQVQIGGRVKARDSGNGHTQPTNGHTMLNGHKQPTNGHTTLNGPLAELRQAVKQIERLRKESAR